MNVLEIKTSLERAFGAGDHFIFLFGSRAKGDAKTHSDWDIGILSNARIRPATMLRAREELEKIRTLDRFDLVDFSMTSPEFKKNASKTIVPLVGDGKKWTKKLSGTP